MSITKQKTARRKRCSECNELKHDVLGRQRLCEDCEQRMNYCAVCDEWMYDYNCRHGGWFDAGGYECGCGTTQIDADAHKQSFMLLCEKLAPIEVEFHREQRLLERMAEEIAANNFWTRWHGPMIGAPPDLCLHYEKDFGTHRSVLALCDIHYTTQEAWGEQAIDEMQLGMAWLTSLDDTTKKANKITVGWIREFLSPPNPPAGEGAERE